MAVWGSRALGREDAKVGRQEASEVYHSFGKKRANTVYVYAPKMQLIL